MKNEIKFGAERANQGDHHGDTCSRPSCKSHDLRANSSSCGQGTQRDSAALHRVLSYETSTGPSSNTGLSGLPREAATPLPVTQRCEISGHGAAGDLQTAKLTLPASETPAELVLEKPGF